MYKAYRSIEIRDLCLLEFFTEVFVLLSSFNYPRIHVHFYEIVRSWTSMRLREFEKWKNIGNRHSAKMYYI